MWNDNILDLLDLAKISEATVVCHVLGFSFHNMHYITDWMIIQMHVEVQPSMFYYLGCTINNSKPSVTSVLWWHTHPFSVSHNIWQRMEEHWLTIPITKHSKFENWGFAVLDATYWNKLSGFIRNSSRLDKFLKRTADFSL